MGKLESAPGTEGTLAWIVEELAADDPAEVTRAVGALLREGLIRVRRVGSETRYIIAP